MDSWGGGEVHVVEIEGKRVRGVQLRARAA
jgi:hypothetical protein